MTNDSVLGKAFGLGMGERNGDEVTAEEEAFKDGHWDKQSCPPTPPQMSWEEVVGGGKRKREGGRGQVSNPEPERGDTQMLADGMQRMAECKLHLTV